MESISVIIADDHRITRMGIRTILEIAPDIRVVGEAADGYETLTKVNDLHADILVLDIEMPILTGIEVARILNGTNTPIAVLILSAYDDLEYIRGVLKAGAVGYLTKDEAPEHLVEAVRGIAHGEWGWFTNRVAEDVESLSKDIHPRQRAGQGLSRLVTK